MANGQKPKNIHGRKQARMYRTLGWVQNSLQTMVKNPRLKIYNSKTKFPTRIRQEFSSKYLATILFYTHGNSSPCLFDRLWTNWQGWILTICVSLPWGPSNYYVTLKMRKSKSLLSHKTNGIHHFLGHISRYKIS